MLKRIFSTSIYSIASRFFSTATSLVIIFFISRLMDPESLGRYGIAFFFFQLFIVFSYFGLEVFVGKEVAYKRDNPVSLNALFNELLSATLWGLLISLALLSIALFFYHRISPSLLFLAMLAGVFYGLERNLGGFLLGRERMGVDAVFMALSFFLTLALIWFYRDQLTIERIFLIRTSTLALGVTGRGIYVLRGLHGFKFRWHFEHFKEVKYYWNFTFLVFLERQADLFLLSLFIDQGVLGGYFLSLRIYLTINLLIEVLAQSLTPFLSRVFRGKEEVGLKRFIARMFPLSMGFGIILAALLFVSRGFLISLFNKSLVAETAPFLAVLSLAVPFKVGAYMLGAVLSSSKYQKLRFSINLVTTVLYLLVLAVAIPVFSAPGAVFARAGFEVFTFLGSVYFVLKVVKKEDSL